MSIFSCFRLCRDNNGHAWTCEVKYLRKRAVEFYLNRFGHRPEAINPLWELKTAELREIAVRWPSQYEWAAASDWVDAILFGLRRYVPVKVVDDLPQLFAGTVTFQMVISGRAHNIAIGYSDYRAIDDDCARTSALYFKMQFDRNGYPFPNVVPGGYVPDGKRLYANLKHLRRVRDRCEYLHDVSGRFSLNYAREIREKAVSILSDQNSFEFNGGLSKIAYADFLKEVARSRICIDLPGLGDLCFRSVNYLAIGSCIIAYPHGSMMHVPLVDREHVIYCREDMSDLVELCEYYLSHDKEREQIAANSRQYFDLNLHKDNLVRYYLRTCIDRLR